MSNIRLAVVIAIVALTGLLLYLLAPVLAPFTAAALLAYIGNPLVSRLERVRVPRVVGVSVVFLFFVLVLLGLVLYLVPVLHASLNTFVAHVPEYYDWIAKQLPRLEAWLGIPLNLDLNTLRDGLVAHWKEVGNWTAGAIGVATQSGMTVVGWMVNLVLVPIVTFYLLLDWKQVVAWVDARVPQSYKVRVRRIARETDTVLGSFLRGQLLVMIALAVIYSVGLLLVGLDLAIPIGLVSGLVSFVPYLGFLVGIVSASIAAYLQFQDAFVLVWVFAAFMVGQFIESYFLTPRLVGRRIGLHPVAVLFAIMAGGQLFGFSGVLLALPVAAALKVWLHHAHDIWAETPAVRPRRR